MRKLTFPLTVKIINGQLFTVRLKKPKLLVLLIAICSLYSSHLYALGESCESSLNINFSREYAENHYTFNESQGNLYINFQARDSSILFMVYGTDEWPAELRLYSESCEGEPLMTQILHIDSNNASSLSLSYFNLIPESSYFLRISRDPASNGDSFDFILRSVYYNHVLTCDPSPCPVKCNILYNGSFETPLYMPIISTEIDAAKWWIKPSTYTWGNANASDYFHQSLNTFSVPQNYFIYSEAVNGLDGDDAYAGLFTLYGSKDIREWMSGTLRQTLIQGHRYRIEFYVRLSDHSYFDSPCIAPGIKFSSTHLSTASSAQIIAMEADIQPTAIVNENDGWVKVTGEYLAQGNENYLVISNFLSNNESVAPSQVSQYNKSYFIVDEISVTDMGSCCDNELVIQDMWTVQDILNSPEFAPFINGNVLSVPNPIKVEGDFIIDQNFTIHNSHMVMAPYSEIKISGSNILSLNGSILDVCGNIMWNGITVNGTTSKVVVNNSEIWEAIKGINSINGGNFQVSNALFDGNYYGIYVDEYNGLHPGKVSGSTFQCSDFLLTPYQASFPGGYSGLARAGIYINKVDIPYTSQNAITIGETEPNSINTFIGNEGPTPDGGVIIIPSPGLLNGIELYHSSANIYNNSFERFGSNQLSPIVPTNRNAGIKVEGHISNDIYITHELSLEVGGYDLFERNYFYNSVNGIVLENCSGLNVYNNHFDMGAESYSLAIKIKDNFGYYPNIKNNTILNTSHGIEIVNNFDDFPKVQDNYIHLISDWYTVGIYYGDTDFGTITGNTILNANVGILVENSNPPQNITSNTIRLKDYYIPPVNVIGLLPNCGIRFINSAGSSTKISENSIYMDNRSFNGLAMGISMEMSAYYEEISCNNIENTGTGILLSGVTYTYPPYNELNGNVFNNNHNGLVLTNGSALYDIGSTTRPSDNQWTGTFTGYHTYTDGADGSNTTLYTRGGGLPYVPQVNGSSANQPLQINSTASGTVYACESDGGGEPPVRPDFDFSIVENNGDRSASEQWLLEYQAYKGLLNDSIIEDSLAQHFEDSMDNTALGQALALMDTLDYILQKGLLCIGQGAYSIYTKEHTMAMNVNIILQMSLRYKAA